MSESFESMRISLWNDSFIKKRLTQELIYDSGTDIENCTNVLNGLLNSGWQIDDVFVNTDECVTPVNATVSESVLALLDALIEETYDTTRILVYGEAFGWEESYFESSRYGRGYEEGFYQESDSREDAAEEFHNELYHEDRLTNPYAVIDWEATARHMETDNWVFHERNGNTYLLLSE